MYGLLADLVLLAHVGFALFIVLGLAAVWVGWAAGWGWVRNRWFRGAHLAAMGVVVLETALGWFCPLTRWELALRRLAGQDPAYQGSFMHHWAQQLFYFDLSPRAFLAMYSGVFLLMAATVFLVPVRWKTGKKLPDA